MKSALSLVLLVVGLASVGNSFGQDQQESLRFVVPLGFDLRVLDLESVQSRFGNAPIASKGRYQDQVCYLWPDAMVVYSGYNTFWMAFEMSSVAEPAPRDCVAINGQGASVPLDVAGLHLGMTEEEFISTIGGEPEWSEDKLIVQFEWVANVNVQPPGSGIATLTTEVRVEGTFSGQRLISFRIVYGAST